MQGKMNRSLYNVGGNVLAVPQFTPSGDARKGNRTSFDAAASAEKALQLYYFFINEMRTVGFRCESGRLQESMRVELVNEEPVSILQDSQKNF